MAADLERPLTLRPTVVVLADPIAADADLTGAKATALATAAAAGLPVLPGFVITTAASDEARIGGDVRAAWEELTAGGERSVVVRSSSTTEDLEGSSMAGRYESVIDVRGWDAFVDAVGVVMASQRTAAEGSATLTGEEPLAVLVQPMLEAVAGGVMFGVEPVSGRTDRVVVAASGRGADAVVSGEVNGSRYVLDRAGAVIEVDDDGDSPLDDGHLRALVELADRCATTFGGHQDVEWALRDDGELVLLQSRPVTTEVVGVPVGPLFGRGPVAETFPEPLAALEQDLWVPALRGALREALRLAGAATAERLDETPLVVVVDGDVAVDLEATGEVVAPPTLAQRIDPRTRVRRLLSAWRLGRLRAALPALTDGVVDRCDAALAAVPDLQELTDRQLLAVLAGGEPALRSLHAHEILMGQLVDPGAPRLTGTSVALRVLAHARAAGTDEDEIPRRHPVVLTLAPPRISPTVSLPGGVEAPPWDGDKDRDRDAILREALRLRVRWMHELTGRAAWTLGERLHERGVLQDPAHVRHLRLEELRAAVLDEVAPADGASRSADGGRRVPPRFRLTADGRPVMITTSDDEHGTGAGGGRGTGPVCHDIDAVEDGSVLVVPTLDASLATSLPRLAGLVAETGSVLAHIAILAREAGVPTVVGASGAVARYPVGAVVRVDGTSGTVDIVEDA